MHDVARKKKKKNGATKAIMRFFFFFFLDVFLQRNVEVKPSKFVRMLSHSQSSNEGKGTREVFQGACAHTPCMLQVLGCDAGGVHLDRLRFRRIHPDVRLAVRRVRTDHALLLRVPRHGLQPHHARHFPRRLSQQDCSDELQLLTMAGC